MSRCQHCGADDHSTPTCPDPRPELAPKAEWMGSFGGFPIYVDPAITPGWVQFRDGEGRIIGMISDVGEIRVAKNRSP
jgi:hypothetical protein